MIENISEGAKGLFGGLLKKDDDTIAEGEKNVSSGPIEDITETISQFVNIPEEIVQKVTDAIALPSVRSMVKEINNELEASDKVCDRVGGQSAEIPLLLLPDPEFCLAPQQIGWALKPSNLPKTFKIALSCGIEENVSEPIDFWLSLGKIIQGGNYEKLSGWLTGLLAGEAVPDLVNPYKWLYFPSTFSSCIQAKIAKEMGTLTPKDYEKLQKDVFSFTGRDSGMAKQLIGKIDESTNPLVENVSNTLKNIGI